MVSLVAERAARAELEAKVAQLGAQCTALADKYDALAGKMCPTRAVPTGHEMEPTITDGSLEATGEKDDRQWYFVVQSALRHWAPAL
jgi:hypothetical protein